MRPDHCRDSGHLLPEEGDCAMSNNTGSRGLGGKVAIVTGAGSRTDGIGNGRAAAILLARNGMRVALLDERTEWPQGTHTMIAAENGESFVVRCDVSTLGHRQAPVQHDCKQLKERNDLVVNSTGSFQLPRSFGPAPQRRDAWRGRPALPRVARAFPDLPIGKTTLAVKHIVCSNRPAFSPDEMASSTKNPQAASLIRSHQALTPAE
jgi:hypothetical protein